MRWFIYEPVSSFLSSISSRLPQFYQVVEILFKRQVKRCLNCLFQLFIAFRCRKSFDNVLWIKTIFRHKLYIGTVGWTRAAKAGGLGSIPGRVKPDADINLPPTLLLLFPSQAVMRVTGHARHSNGSKKQVSPVATGSLVGLAPPKQSSKPPKLKRETL